MNAVQGHDFYNEYPELAKIRDAIRGPFAAAFPNPGNRLEVATITLPVPRLETRRESRSPLGQALEALPPMRLLPSLAVVTDDGPALAPMAPKYTVMHVPPFCGFQGFAFDGFLDSVLNSLRLGQPAFAKL